MNCLTTSVENAYMRSFNSSLDETNFYCYKGRVACQVNGMHADALLKSVRIKHLIEAIMATEQERISRQSTWHSTLTVPGIVLSRKENKTQCFGEFLRPKTLVVLYGPKSHMLLAGRDTRARSFQCRPGSHGREVSPIGSVADSNLRICHCSRSRQSELRIPAAAVEKTDNGRQNIVIDLLLLTGIN